VVVEEYFRTFCRKHKAHFVQSTLNYLGFQCASTTTSRLSRAPINTPRPPIAFLLILVAKFFGPSSSAPEGGPRGCLSG